MPKKLDTKKVKNEFASYGYKLPDNFVHKTVTTRYKVIDDLTGKSEYLSLNELRYKVGRHQRSLVESSHTPTAKDMVENASRATVKKSKLRLMKQTPKESTDIGSMSMEERIQANKQFKDPSVHETDIGSVPADKRKVRFNDPLHNMTDIGSMTQGQKAYAQTKFRQANNAMRTFDVGNMSKAQKNQMEKDYEERMKTYNNDIMDIGSMPRTQPKQISHKSRFDANQWMRLMEIGEQVVVVGLLPGQPASPSAPS